VTAFKFISHTVGWQEPIQLM